VHTTKKKVSHDSSTGVAAVDEKARFKLSSEQIKPVAIAISSYACIKASVS